MGAEVVVTLLAKIAALIAVWILQSLHLVLIVVPIAVVYVKRTVRVIVKIPLNHLLALAAEIAVMKLVHKTVIIRVGTDVIFHAKILVIKPVRVIVSNLVSEIANNIVYIPVQQYADK